MDMTHEVFNQPAPLSDYNLFDTNRPLRDALKFNAPALDTYELSQLGAKLGSAAMQIHARLANASAPGMGKVVHNTGYTPAREAVSEAAQAAEAY
jgi:putative acyl-CoA dehydrogenase